MSTMSEKAREAAKSKVERLTRSDPLRPVDASGYRPEGAMDADVQTGERPISRRQFRRGGAVEGSKGVMRADRKPRASGGKALSADSYINRDVREANKERDGIKHDGGFKCGGRAGKLAGGPLMQATGSPQLPPTTVGRKEGGRIHASGCQCSKCGGRVERKEGGATKSPVYGGTRPVAGRLARKGGGRTKGKTNVNIIITQPGGMAGPMPPPGVGPPPGGPVGLHQGAPPMPPPGAVPPPAAMPMPRKSGGRTLEKDGGKLAKPGAYPIESGGGGGLGRLEKAKAYG